MHRLVACASLAAAMRTQPHLSRRAVLDVAASTAAVFGTFNHIQKFWEPRMRATLLETFDAGGDHGMHELVVAAVTEHRAGLERVTL